MTKYLLMLCLLGLPAVAQAQIINPTKAEFTASLDHAAVFAGTAVLDHYELVIVRQSAPTVPVVPAVNLGKPTPVANLITVPLPAGLPNNTLLQAQVRSVGPGGTNASALSDPFGVVGAPVAPGKPIPKP